MSEQKVASLWDQVSIFRLFKPSRFQKYKFCKNPNQYGWDMTFIVNKYLPYLKSYNDKNYKDNGWLMEKVINYAIVLLLKVRIMRKRMPKMEAVWESYYFYKIITIIKTSEKTKVKTSQNYQKESYRGQRDL